MIKFRNSLFTRTVCFLLAISIFTISCDPNGDLLTESKISKQAESIASAMNGEFSCAEIEDYLRKAVNYVRLNHSNGIITNEGDLLQYLIEDAKSENKLSDKDLSGLNLVEIGEKMTSLHYSTSTESVYDLLLSLKSNGEISEEHFNIIMELEQDLKSNPKEKALSIIDNHIADVLQNNTIDSESKESLAQAMELVKFVLCEPNVDFNVSSSLESGENAESRCEHEVCWEEHRWELAISFTVTSVAAVIGIILGFLTPLILVLILVATWVLITIVICIILDCDPDCPEGTELTCAEGFILENGFCCHPTANIVEGTGVFAAMVGSTCPPGYIPLGNGQCFLGTFETLGLTTDLGVTRYDECGGFVGHIPFCQ